MRHVEIQQNEEKEADELKSICCSARLTLLLSFPSMSELYIDMWIYAVDCVAIGCSDKAEVVGYFVVVPPGDQSL